MDGIFRQDPRASAPIRTGLMEAIAQVEPQRGSGRVPTGDNLAYYLNSPAFLGMSAGRITPYYSR